MLAQRLVSAPRASTLRGDSVRARGRDAFERYETLWGVQPEQGTIVVGTPAICKPGTRQQQFPKPFSEARAGQVSRATGRGRSFSKGPESLSLKPMRNREFPVHCCLWLTPQRSASGLAVFEQGALPSPPSTFRLHSQNPNLSGSRGWRRGGTRKKRYHKGPSSPNHKSFCCCCCFAGARAPVCVPFISSLCTLSTNEGRGGEVPFCRRAIK